MEKLISKLVNRFVKESFVDITDKDTDEAFQEVTEKLHGGQHKIDVAEPKGKITAADFKKLKQMKKHETSEAETEEGNAFTGALAKAKEEGDDTFEVDGETYSVKKESVNKKIERILENRKKKLNEKWDDSFEDKRGGSYIGKPLERLQMDLAAMNSKIENFKKENEGEEVPSKMKEKLNQIKFAIRNARKTKNEGEVKEEKFIQKATQKMEKKGTSGKFGTWCKNNNLDKDGEVTKRCIDKAMKSEDSKVVKMANFAKNIGGFKGAKHESIKENTVRFTESEMIDFIERIVEAEVKEKNTVKSLSMSKKVNDDATKEVVKKMKDYMKNMGTEYEPESESFPKGNKIMARQGKDNKEITDDVKKAYKASEQVEEYVENFTAAGLENLDYDNIKPNEDWVTDNIEGSSRTGNSPEYANAVKTDVNKKINEKRKKNLLAVLKRQAYNKAPQPTHEDEAGEIVPSAKNPKGNAEVNKIMAKESIEEKKIINDLEKMKKLINYNQKTQ